MIQAAIQKKKRTLELGSDSQDILSSLLKVRDETGEPIPEKQIIDESFNFLFAGHGKCPQHVCHTQTNTFSDTMSSLLSWAMTFLSRDSDVVHNIREEVNSVVGDRVPQYEDVKNLQYCQMVVKEVCPFLVRKVAKTWRLIL